MSFEYGSMHLYQFLGPPSLHVTPTSSFRVFFFKQAECPKQLSVLLSAQLVIRLMDLLLQTILHAVLGKNVMHSLIFLGTDYLKIADGTDSHQLQVLLLIGPLLEGHVIPTSTTSLSL
jgi:hypothetical protein